MGIYFVKITQNDDIPKVLPQVSLITTIEQKNRKREKKRNPEISMKNKRIKVISFHTNYVHF